MSQEEPAARATESIRLDVRSTNPLAILLRSESLWPVYEILHPQLTSIDIVNLGKTCRALREWYGSTWDINEALARFTGDPRRFRSAINRVNAVMTGTFVLDFFDRAVSESSVLEVVVGAIRYDRTKPLDVVTDDSEMTRLKSYKDFFDYLVDVEGYTAHSPPVLTSLDESVLQKWCYSSAELNDARSRHIDTLTHASRGARILLHAPLSYRQQTLQEYGADRVFPRRGWRSMPFWASKETLCALAAEMSFTASANFIVADHAISLFPGLTYKHRTAYALWCSERLLWDGRSGIGLLKDRNIEPSPSIYQSLPEGEAWFKRVSSWVEDPFVWYEEERQVMGPRSWVLRLSTDGIEPSPISTGVLAAAHMTLSVRSLEAHTPFVPPTRWPTWESMADSKLHYVQITTELFSSPALRYWYEMSCIRPRTAHKEGFQQTLHNFVCERSEKAWVLKFKRARLKAAAAADGQGLWATLRRKKRNAKVKLSLADQNEINSLWQELMNRNDAWPDGWYMDDSVAAWIRDYEASRHGLYMWPQDPENRLRIPGITPAVLPTEDEADDGDDSDGGESEADDDGHEGA